MRRAINTSVRSFSECFGPVGPVVDIGSLYLPGYEELSDLRPVFKGLEYVGCDIRQGLGVDRIEDAHALSFPDKSFGTVLLLDILEHLPYPEKAVSEARRVLSDEGLLVLSVPFAYRLHGFPTDYWRFSSSGIYTLLSDFPDKVVFALGPRVKPAFIFGIAAKSSFREFPGKEARFQAKVNETFQNFRARLGGHISALKERGRDFFGSLLGRADLSVIFFDPSKGGGYINQSYSEPFRTPRSRGDGPHFAGRTE